MNKFFEIKNITSTKADLYIYGEIVTEKWYDYEVDLKTFKEQLDSLGDIKELNIYINSPGGSVFVASTMISMLKRLKDNGIIINAYVDGIAASAASLLLMVANNIYLYQNSIVMIHKPMTFAYGNAFELQKEIDALNKVEDSVAIPMYLEKAKISEEELRQKINDETWFNAEEMNDCFEVTCLDEEKQVAACLDMNIFKNYKNIPTKIIEYTKNKENSQKEIKNKENNSKKREVELKLKLLDTSLFLIEKGGIYNE